MTGYACSHHVNVSILIIIFDHNRPIATQNFGQDLDSHSWTTPTLLSPSIFLSPISTFQCLCSFLSPCQSPQIPLFSLSCYQTLPFPPSSLPLPVTPPLSFLTTPFSLPLPIPPVQSSSMPLHHYSQSDAITGRHWTTLSMPLQTLFLHFFNQSSLFCLHVSISF